jgi:Flp pilus assembly protein TadB
MIYLVAAMVVFWITTFVFVFSVMRRERRLEMEVEALRDAMDQEATR